MLKKSSLNSLQELLDGLVDLTNKPVLQVFKSLIFDYSNDDKKISRYDKKDGNKANDVQDYCFCVTMILWVVGWHGCYYTPFPDSRSEWLSWSESVWEIEERREAEEILCLSFHFTPKPVAKSKPGQIQNGRVRIWTQVFFILYSWTMITLSLAYPKQL